MKTAAGQKTAEPARVGTRVKTDSFCMGSIPSQITKIESIHKNELGTTIYVMETGQHLAGSEFIKY